MRRAVALSLLTLIVACGKARDVTHEEKAACTTCHGGLDNQTGAPPYDVRGNTDPGVVSVGAHTTHVGRAGFACTECHPDALVAARHPDGKVEVVFGALARRNGANPVYSSGTCSNVYCHGQFTGGNGSAGVSWTGGAAAAACGTCHGSTTASPPSLPPAHPGLAAGATQATCHRCHPDSVNPAGELVAAKHADGTIDVLAAANHPDGWSAKAQHGLAAAGDVRACLECHAAKGTPVVTALVCSSCHDALAGGADWTVTCNTCHGSAANAAPPKDTSGNTATTVRTVGAHQAHLAGSALAPAFGCEFCHAVPTDVTAEGHLDGALTVSGYTGASAVWRAAVGAPGLGGAGPSCGTSYCHGSFRQGNTTNAPVWTQVGQGQAACGTCHGLPPALPHPQVSMSTCSGCHGDTMTAGGGLIPVTSGGKHLDGVVEANGHDAAWMEIANPGFHAFFADAGLASCAPCHGADLAGGATGVACAQCHTASWKTTCTMCHGGTANATGAPPKATWGHRTPADATNVRIGAHTAHVTASAIAPAFACTTCHPARTSALDSGHLDGKVADVAFGTFATHGGTLTPAWDRGAGTCASTYCHAGKGGGVAQPVWTAGASQGTCGSCHGLPPPSPHPAVAAGLPGCATCHPQTMTEAGALIPPASGGKHLDGTVTLGHLPSFIDPTSPSFHAFAANEGLDTCKACHGATLDGQGSAFACATCHGPTWKTRCTMCHGGTANATGAPPKATWGNTLPADRTNVRIGAHTVHAAGTTSSPAIACTVCHPAHTSALDAGHLDGGTATVVLGGLSGGGTWDRATGTCSGTYCHDGGRFGNDKAPTWTAAGPAACTSCHLAPPDDVGHNFHSFRSIPCSGCHGATTATRADPAYHVNGAKDVLYHGARISTGWSSCTGCHN